MPKGQVRAPEWDLFLDRITGIPVRRLTSSPWDSHHLYFTNSGWYDDNSRLLFVSHRDHSENLHSLEMETGKTTQLTDISRNSAAHEGSSLVYSCVSVLRKEAYFWVGKDLVCLDLQTLSERTLYRAPDGFSVNMLTVTADGRYVCTAHYEDMSSRFNVDLLRGYIGFYEYWESRPRSRIVRIDIETGRHEVIHEENYWLGHVNASPTNPCIATFCHEGPWDKVDQRIWGLDIETGRRWRIGKRKKGEKIGHEYWLSDGLHIAFQIKGRDIKHRNQGDLLGVMRFDGDEQMEFPLHSRSTHLHSLDVDMVVGDGEPSAPLLYVWRRQDGKLVGPHIIGSHDCRARTQATHVHPRFSPDGRQLIFVSDRTGSGNIYMIETSSLGMAS